MTRTIIYAVKHYSNGCWWGVVVSGILVIRYDTSWHKRPVERSLDVGSCGQPVFGSWPYTIRQPGFDLPRHTWSMLNRFRTGRGTCPADLHQWGLSTSESCICGQKQTMSHIVDSCPVSRFEGGSQQLHTADDRAVHWLETAAKTALAKGIAWMKLTHIGPG